mgnify:FL=1
MNPSHDLQGLKKKAKETFLYALSALLLGIAIGAIDAIFGRVLLFITDFRSAHVVVLLPFLPLAGLGIVWLYRHFNETAAKGMTLVMEAGQGKRESIPLALIPLVMAGTWITHLFGGSAGREGVAVQIGATLSHAFARRFHFPDNGRIVLIAGIWRPLSDSVCSSLFCDGSSGEWKYGIFRIASCSDCVFYGICNFACAGAGKIFGSSFADPVIDGHKDGDISDSFWNLVRSDGTAVCGAFAKSKTVYGKRTGKSIQENRLCVDPTGGVSFSGVERTVLRTWNQSDRAGIFRWRTVYV